jgi:hypothetical protein
MMNCFPVCYKFAFHLNLRCYTTADTEEVSPTFTATAYGKPHLYWAPDPPMLDTILLLLVIPEVDLINFGGSQFGETG